MMGAVQPFISGAISKTINMPAEATVDEVARGLRHGVEARPEGGRDLSRRLQAHAAAQHRQEGDEPPKAVAAAPALRRSRRVRLQRRKLPDERHSITHKFDIAGHEGYITVGMYEDGTPGEIFVSMSKQGSTISGLMDSFATAISYALQYGVPLQFLVDKFAHMRFEPSGFTKNPQIPYAKSIVDYLFRWMASKFLDEEAKREVGIIGADESSAAEGARRERAGARVGAGAEPARTARTPGCGRRSSIRPMRRRVRIADASWCATAPATSA